MARYELHLAIIAIVIGTIVSGGCSRHDQPPNPAQTASPKVASASMILVAEHPPAALGQIGESAEVIFDAARASKWTEAAASMQSLKKFESDLPSTGLKPDLDAKLRSRIVDLGESVKVRERARSMDFANGITHIVADLSSPYQVKIPYEMVLLDYYGRQIELGLAASQPSTLKQATADLRQTWNAVEPSILQRGHVEDARRFADIVAQLEAAKRPADFVAPVRAELAAVDQLEKIFAP
jgi:hypothetical protein